MTFTYPGDQQVTTAWNAVVQQTGRAVSATNAAWDGAIAAGGSAGLGISGAYRTSHALPLALTCQAS